MSYVQSTLADGERVLAQAKLHWLIWLRAYLVLALLGILVVGVIYFIIEWLRIANTEVALTDRRLVLKQGFITVTLANWNSPALKPSISIKASLAGSSVLAGSMCKAPAMTLGRRQ